MHYWVGIKNDEGIKMMMNDVLIYVMIRKKWVNAACCCAMLELGSETRVLDKVTRFILLISTHTRLLC